MKGGREHRVPLPKRALEILDQVETIRASDYVFPGKLLPPHYPVRRCTRCCAGRTSRTPPCTASGALPRLSRRVHVVARGCRGCAGSRCRRRDGTSLPVRRRAGIVGSNRRSGRGPVESALGQTLPSGVPRSASALPVSTSGSRQSAHGQDRSFGFAPTALLALLECCAPNRTVVQGSWLRLLESCSNYELLRHWVM
jgi:hypothetical protein